MSDFLHTVSCVLGEEEKQSLVSYSVPSNTGHTTSAQRVDQHDRVSSKVVNREFVVAAKNQPLAPQTLPQLHPHRDPSRVAIRSGGKVLLLDPREVIAVIAQGNYVALRRQADSHLVRERISVIAEKLRCYGFVQIHRSVLVNRLYVEEIRGVPTGGYILRIRSGKEYTVTRTYQRMLIHLAEVWIGTDGFTAEQ